MSDTNEQRARELIGVFDGFFDAKPQDIEAIARALDEAEARGAAKWRPVSEDPPPQDVPVLVAYEGLRKDHAECPGRIDRAWHAGFSAATGEGEGP